MTSPRPSLDSSSSIISTSSSDGEVSEEDVRVPQTLAPPPPSSKTVQTTVTVGKVVMKEDAQMPGVLNGTFAQTNINYYISGKGYADPNDLVTDAVKVNAETLKSFQPTGLNNHSVKFNGTKEDVEGLSRRWCYLITALVILSLITLLGTAVLSVTNWRTSQGPALTPAIQSSVDGLTAEEKQFAAIPHGPPIVTRSSWLAAPPTEPLDNNTLPATLVVVCHTATGNCSSQPECIESARFIQRFHQASRHFADVGYNFLIGGDGSVYWGRGFTYLGAHTKGFNYGSVAVAFIGTYVDIVPNERQIEAFNRLMHVGLKEGKIVPDYTLVAQCQLQVTAAPGRALVHAMASWPHYNTSLPVMCTEG